MTWRTEFREAAKTTLELLLGAQGKRNVKNDLKELIGLIEHRFAYGLPAIANQTYYGRKTRGNTMAMHMSSDITRILWSLYLTKLQLRRERLMDTCSWHLLPEPFQRFFTKHCGPAIQDLLQAKDDTSVDLSTYWQSTVSKNISLVDQDKILEATEGIAKFALKFFLQRRGFGGPYVPSGAYDRPQEEGDYQCEFDCGFCGTFAQVEEHETRCHLRPQASSSSTTRPARTRGRLEDG